MPRRYRLGERATHIQATRDRILDAAIELYMEVGISAATMREIGRRADVAPGTLRNHFPTRDQLDRALVERMAAGIDLPDTSIFDDAATLEVRLARVILAGGAFTDQARPLYRMWQREPLLTGPWLAKGAEFGARWDELLRAALGPMADDEEALVVLRAVIHPDFFASIRGRTRSPADAAALITAVVVPWFAAHGRKM
jgi:AcrR family transcriptional regulator